MGTIPVVLNLPFVAFEHWEAESERLGKPIHVLLEVAAMRACIPPTVEEAFIRKCQQRYIEDADYRKRLKSERPRRRLIEAMDLPKAS